MKWPFETSILRMSFVLALVILIANTAASYLAMVRFNEARHRRVHTRDTVIALRDLLADLEVAESGCRVYMITGDTDHLQVYESLMKEIPPEIKKVETLTAGIPSQQARFKTALPLIEQLRSILDKSIRLVQRGRTSTPVLPSVADEGKQVMDKIRRIVGEMVEEGENSISAQDSDTYVLARNAIGLTAIGDFLSSVLLLLVIVVLVKEMRRRKRQEVEIRDLNDDLRRRAAELAEINRELDSFSSAVSHDLRAPLAAIDGYSYAILDHSAAALDDQTKDDLRQIRASAKQMANIISSLLTLSRVKHAEMKRERIDLSQMAHAAVEKLRAASPERKADVTIAPELSATGDPDLLRLVLENLLSNAWKFSRDADTAKIEFGVAQQAGGPAYFVRDNGVGFDMARAGRLFQPFTRLHGASAFEGSGIGLATVRRIIQRHGGRVWAQSEEGKGATIYFTLP